MWSVIGILFGFFCLVFVIATIARRAGANSAKIEALRKEINKRAEEQERANKIADTVDNLTIDDVRKRLHDELYK